MSTLFSLLDWFCDFGFIYKFFFPVFFYLVGEGKKSCLYPFRKMGGVSQDRRRLFSFSCVTFTLPTLVNTDATWQLMKSLYENKKTAKKKTTFKRNNSLHVYYASLNEQRKPSGTSWSMQEDFHDNCIHSSRVLWAFSYIWSQCHPPATGSITNVTAVLGFPLSFGHLWSVVG